MERRHFFCPDLSSQKVELPEEEAKHLNVLRMQPGDRVFLLDGQGVVADAELEKVSKRSATLTVLERNEHPRPSRNLHLFVSPPKSGDRLEWIIEKCTEMGASSMTMLLTEQSERKRVNLERLQKIAVSAMKQSGNAWLPAFGDLESLGQALESARGKVFIAHCEEEQPRVSFEEASSVLEEVSIFIGPEGDFSSSEIQSALSAGAQPVSLGDSRLRTETAAVVACAIFMCR